MTPGGSESILNRYFGMFVLRTPDATVVSSEIVPQLAPAEQWRPLPADHLLTIPLSGTDGPSQIRGEENLVH